MSDSIKEIKDFFSLNSSLKSMGKDFLQLHKQITDYKKTSKQRSERLNDAIVKLVQLACELAEKKELSSIWQPLVDVTSEIINCYGALHASTDPQSFDVFFKPLLQEIQLEEHSELYKFLERLLARVNIGFRISASEFFRKLFFDAFASNVKRKLKESYDLFRIVHVHIPEIIGPILSMHQNFLKNPNPEQRQYGVRFIVDVLTGVYTIREELSVDVLDDFRKNFHEKDSESQRILIENLSKYLLRKSYVTNILIDDLKQCFENSTVSNELLFTLVQQITSAIKECYHAAPDALLNLLFNGCEHSNALVAIECIETIAYLYRLYYVKDPYPSATRSRLDVVPRIVLHAAVKHPDLIVRVESQTKFFENIIFEHYRIEERTRQFFIFAQTNLSDEGVRNYGQLLHLQSELRSLIHEALVKSCTTVTASSIDLDETPELDDEDDDDEQKTKDEEKSDDLTEILQKISELCFLPRENGVNKLRHWLTKSEPRAREQFQSISSLTIDGTLSRSRMSSINDESTMIADDAIQLVEERLASRVSIVFSTDFLQEFPSSAQIYFNEAKMYEEELEEDEEPQREQQQNRCIKQIGKLTKVLRAHLENTIDLEILEKFIEIIDENQPILSTFVFGVLSEFGALLGPGPIKTNLINRLVEIVMDSIRKGDRSTMGKWAMRALVPIVGSNEQQLEYIITHDLFGKTKTSWWSNEGAASAHRWLLLSHIVECAPASRTMFNIVEQIVKVILRHFSNPKTIGAPIDSFDQISDEVQTRANQLKFLSRSLHCIRAQNLGQSFLETDDEQEERSETLISILKFLLKLVKDVFIFPENEIGRHFLQLQAAIEVLRMLQTPEIFHSFTDDDYVDLFSAATHQNSQVRHRFLQRVLNKVAQWKLSVLLLGLTVSVPNDDEDASTGKNLKSVMERLYHFASKGSVETMQRLLPEKSISLMVYLHANNRNLLIEVDREVVESISNSVKWCLRMMLQAREKTGKRFHGAIPKLLHSLKHSRSKFSPDDQELHQRIYLVVDIFQSVFADLSPLEAYDFADTRNNLSGEPLLFEAPDFTKLNTRSYLPEFYKEKKVTKRSKKDEQFDEATDEEIEEENEEISSKKRFAERDRSTGEETLLDETNQNEEKENKKKNQKRKFSQSKRSRKRISK